MPDPLAGEWHAAGDRGVVALVPLFGGDLSLLLGGWLPDGRLVIECWGGALHGQGETVPEGETERAWAKWMWRLAHQHLTHPEWFGPRRRGHPTP